MHLVYLALAVVFEVCWAVAMKLSDGLSRPWPTVVLGVSYVLSLVFLAFATRRMEISVAYALWAGSGAAIIAIIGMWYFKDAVTPLRLVSLALIVAGIVGLNLAGPSH